MFLTLPKTLEFLYALYIEKNIVKSIKEMTGKKEREILVPNISKRKYTHPTSQKTR